MCGGDAPDVTRLTETFPDTSCSAPSIRTLFAAKEKTKRLAKLVPFSSGSDTTVPDITAFSSGTETNRLISVSAGTSCDAYLNMPSKKKNRQSER